MWDTPLVFRTSSYQNMKMLVPNTMNGSDEALKYSLMLYITVLVLFQLVVFELEKCEVPDVSFVTEPKIMGEPVYHRH